MLKGKQKELDKNKDGKISGEDFKMMKAKKGEFMSTSMKDARSVAGKSGGADSGTTGENRSKAGVQEIKIKKAIKDTVNKIKNVATLKSFHDLAKKRSVANLKKGKKDLAGTDEPIKRRKMGGEMKKPMKANMGMEAQSTQGYGAARTSGMGLQDENLIPGKSLDYYKDIM